MARCVLPLLLLLLVVLAALPTAPAAPASAAAPAARCACSDPRLCRPVGGPPLRAREVFGFVSGPRDAASGAYPGVNLSVATTVAWPSDAGFVCAAHAKGVKVVIQPPPVNLTRLLDPARRAEFAKAALVEVQAAGADGVVFDYESPVSREERALSTAYVETVRETTRLLHLADPSYQVTVCVAWSPDDIDGRDYDVAGLAGASDALYVMDYDTRSQIFGVCVASANAPLAGTVHGIGRYLDLGVAPDKLILGVPWYGYRYPCLAGTEPTAVFCPIRSVPFRGVNCSDAAGGEISYAKLMAALANSTTGRRFDASTSSPFFNTVESGNTTVQYWYDDAHSLALKYAVALDNKLRGVGPFTFPDPAGEHAMWGALAAYAAA